jgi:hypothetical protein
MSRSGYSEDCENPQLWRGAVRQAVRGRRGKAFLQELVAALDAMPEKRLIAGELIQDGDVCAIGSVGLRRGLDMSKLDVENPDQIAEAFGIAPCLVQEIEFHNDYEWCMGSNRTDEERWRRMRNWAQGLIDGGDPG